MAMANTLGYTYKLTIAAVRSFMVQASGCSLGKALSLLKRHYINSIFIEPYTLSIVNHEPRYLTV
jgi:hypothetical protein